MRRACRHGSLLALCLGLAACVATANDAARVGIMAAEYAAPTTRYPHGALGDPVEHGQMRVRLSDGRVLAATLPDDLVFEDTAPRLSDLDGDGFAEIIVVESHLRRGARLAVWRLHAGGLTRAAATPFVGRRFRWLAPVGAADLDADGRIEIAYVETPHLGRVLKVLRWQDGQLVPVAELAGVTNHRFGQPGIEGRIARCSGQPTILLADAEWRRVVGARLRDDRLHVSDLGVYRGPQSFQAIAGCD